MHVAVEVGTQASIGMALSSCSRRACRAAGAWRGKAVGKGRSARGTRARRQNGRMDRTITLASQQAQHSAISTFVGTLVAARCPQIAASLPDKAVALAQVGYLLASLHVQALLHTPWAHSYRPACIQQAVVCRLRVWVGSIEYAAARCGAAVRRCTAGHCHGILPSHRPPWRSSCCPPKSAAPRPQPPHLPLRSSCWKQERDTGRQPSHHHMCRMICGCMCRRVALALAGAVGRRG